MNTAEISFAAQAANALSRANSIKPGAKQKQKNSKDSTKEQ